MYWVYLIAAVLGGTVLVVQLLLMMIGLDGGDDGSTEFAMDEAGVGSTDFFAYLSLKSIIAFLTFFGLTGLAVRASGWQPFPGMDIVAAFLAGCLAFYVVGLLMIGMKRLESHGNLDLSQAVGKVATVYLRIPAARSGEGKVTVPVKNQLVEMKAVTQGEEIPTGEKVQVVAFLKPDTLEVASV